MWPSLSIITCAESAIGVGVGVWPKYVRSMVTHVLGILEFEGLG